MMRLMNVKNQEFAQKNVHNKVEQAIFELNSTQINHLEFTAQFQFDIGSTEGT